MDVRYRTNSLTIDIYGIDPLKDKSFQAIHDMKSTKTHLVKSDEVGRPDLISYREYKTTVLWWAILIHNGITYPLDILENTVLKIPDFSNLNTVVNKAVRYEANKTPKFVKI